LILVSVMFVSFHHGIHDHLKTINSIFVTFSIHQKGNLSLVAKSVVDYQPRSEIGLEVCL